MSFTATRHTYFSRRLSLLICSAAILLASQPADAELLNTVQLNFQNGSDSGSFQIAVPEFTDQFQWDLPAPVQVYANDGTGALLGTIKELSVTLDGDPGITLGFHVDAIHISTHVTISSAVLSFAPQGNFSNLFASAAMTVTDNDGDGATATGLFPGGTAYQAQYNGGPIFANLILPVTAPSDGSSTGSGRQPIVGNDLLFPVSSIHSQFDFMLSPNDSASGTSRFNVAPLFVPEPSTLILAVFGFVGLVARRWRRKRCPKT